MVLVEDFERRLGQILDLVNRSKGLVVVEDYELGNRSNQPKEEYHEINPYNDIGQGLPYSSFLAAKY